MMAIIRDVSSRQAVEVALRTREVQYRNVVETIRDVVFQTDADDQWTFLNPAWTEVTDYGIDETIGRRVSACLSIRTTASAPVSCTAR